MRMICEYSHTIRKDLHTDSHEIYSRVFANKKRIIRYTFDAIRLKFERATMGKKKIIQKTSEEVIKESESVETALRRGEDQAVKKKYESGRVYIHASYNNTFITVTDNRGNVIFWTSAGSLGFSGPKKSTPFAASKVAGAIAEKLQRSGPLQVDVFVRGVGSGRDSALRALASRGLNILSIKDVTPIPHNGPRPPKPRRV